MRSCRSFLLDVAALITLSLLAVMSSAARAEPPAYTWFSVAPCTIWECATPYQDLRTFLFTNQSFQLGPYCALGVADRLCAAAVQHEPTALPGLGSSITVTPEGYDSPGTLTILACNNSPLCPGVVLIEVTITIPDGASIAMTNTCLVDAAPIGYSPCVQPAWS